MASVPPSDYPSLAPYPHTQVFNTPPAAASVGGPSQNASPHPGNQSEPKVGACTQCRQRKVKCPGPNPSNDPCPQCLKHGLECVFELHRRGRKLGSKTHRRKRDSADSDAEQDGEQPDGTVARRKSVPEDCERPPVKRTREERPRLDRELPHPLGLLATASTVISDRLNLPPTPGPPPILSTYSKFGGPMNTSLAPELRAAGLGHAFMEILDAFPEEDVIGSGLVTLEEAERLFAFYHSHFAGPTYGLLDRRIHTVSFVRSRSAFLLLVVCLIAARHADWAGHLCEPFHQRMRETVSDGPFLFGGRRSVELVAAILLASNYKRGAGLQVLDQSWQAYGIAFRMATDIGLNNHIHLPPSASLHLRRLARNRERVWIWVWFADRSVASMMGKKWTFMEDEVVMGIAKWVTDGAESGTGLDTDKLLQGVVALARWRAAIHETLPIPSPHAPEPMSAVYRTVIVNMWTAELKRWEMDWVNESTKDTLIFGTLAPVVVAYMRLLLLTRTIGRFGTADWFKVGCACFAHAYESLDLLLTKSPRETLRFVDYRIIVMISYVAIVMIRFRACAPIVRSIYTFAHQVADVLQALGSDPPHKEGPGIEYGRVVKQIAILAQLKDEGRLTSKTATAVEKENDADAAGPSPMVTGLPKRLQSQLGPGRDAHLANLAVGGQPDEQQPLRSFSEVIAQAAGSAPAPTVPPAPPIDEATTVAGHVDPALWQQSYPPGQEIPDFSTNGWGFDNGSPESMFDFGSFDLGMIEELSKFAGNFVGQPAPVGGDPAASATSTPNAQPPAGGLGDATVTAGGSVPLDPKLAGSAGDPLFPNPTMDWSMIF